MHHSSAHEPTPHRANTSPADNPTQHQLYWASPDDPLPGGHLSGQSPSRRSLTTDQIEAWAASTVTGPTTAAVTRPALVADPATMRPKNIAHNGADDGADDGAHNVPQESLLLAAHPSVTTTARHFVTGWAARHHLPTEVTDTLELLTSEVVSNAVIHGQGPICLTIGSPRRPVGSPDPAPQLSHVPPDRVLVQVRDTSSHRPQVQPLTPDLTGGRGLAMVELLARHWGVSPAEDPNGPHGPDVAAGVGKTVWFVLSA